MWIIDVIAFVVIILAVGGFLANAFIQGGPDDR